ncbi:MAG: methyltransferase [Bryobacteraceae bacterium]
MSPSSLPPEAVFMQLANGITITSALGAVARVGVADHMSETPAGVDELALRSNCHEPSLYRVLRFLASIGVFTQDGRKFGLTPVGELLRSDSPRSMRNFAMMVTDPWNVTSHQKLDHSIRTGVDGTTAAYGKHTFDLFREIPDQAETFHRAMTDATSNAVQLLLKAYDFSGIARLADVGGGHGVLLVNVLRRYPEMTGILFDLPEVIAGATETAHFTGLGSRIHYETGSFFETVPDGCDAYIMKSIVHDWDDARAARILSLMREKMAPGGRVLVYEMVVPEDNSPSPSKFLDISMLTLTSGGRERTEQEFAALFASAGLRLNRVVPTLGPMSVMEAYPA